MKCVVWTRGNSRKYSRIFGGNHAIVEIFPGKDADFCGPVHTCLRVKIWTITKVTRNRHFITSNLRKETLLTSCFPHSIDSWTLALALVIVDLDSGRAGDRMLEIAQLWWTASPLWVHRNRNFPSTWTSSLLQALLNQTFSMHTVMIQRALIN